jgi:2-polyprenyl-3-methyl-5-hydroxy-6-metoxy-1,4-benzoquinol methylase
MSRPRPTASIDGKRNEGGTPMISATEHTTEERYSLGRTPEEYERLRMQARIWEAATGRLFDQIGLASGARCLDAGCGPGETMRLMALRVGASGDVIGIDIDTDLAGQAQAQLHATGHRHCRILAHDMTLDEPVPGGPYDLVFARLLLFHLPQRVAVLRRLWDAVAPGGHLVVQDYDLRSVTTTPSLASVDEVGRLILAAFGVAGADIEVGTRLPELFVESGAGAPDGTDVAGRLLDLATSRGMLEQVLRSLLPVALAHGVTTEEEAETALEALRQDAIRYAERPTLWPLLIGAWKRRPPV